MPHDKAIAWLIKQRASLAATLARYGTRTPASRPFGSPVPVARSSSATTAFEPPTRGERDPAVRDPAFEVALHEQLWFRDPE